MGCQRDASTQRTPSTTTACTAAVSHHSILLVRAIKGTQPLASPDLPHMRQKLRGTPGRGMRLSCGMAPPAGRQCCTNSARSCRPSGSQTTGAEPLTCGRPRLSGNSEKVSMYFSQGENSRRCTLGCLHRNAAGRLVVVSGWRQYMPTSEEGGIGLPIRCSQIHPTPSRDVQQQRLHFRLTPRAAGAQRTCRPRAPRLAGAQWPACCRGGTTQQTPLRGAGQA